MTRSILTWRLPALLVPFIDTGHKGSFMTGVTNTFPPGHTRATVGSVGPTIVNFARAGATVGTHTSHPVGVIQVEGGIEGKPS